MRMKHDESKAGEEEPFDEVIARQWIEETKRNFIPAGVTIRGLNAGEVPSMEIRYERIVDGVVETRRLVFE